MISGKEFYNIISHIVPVYVVLILAYGSVKWWKIFSPNECTGINRFVAIFAVPLLSMKYISNINPYTISLRFLAADTLQKAMVLALMFLWCKLSPTATLEWGVTVFQLLVLSNTLLIGIPLLGAMYGEDISEALMAQLSAIACTLWFPVLLFMFEYISATREKDDEKGMNNGEMNGGGGGGVSSYGGSANSKSDGIKGSLDFDDDEVKHVGVLPFGTVDFSDNHDNCGEKVYPSGSPLSKSSSTRNDGEVHVGIGDDESKMKKTQQTQPEDTCVTTKLIMVMVLKKLMKNPNFYASILAVTWCLISYRLNIKMPPILANTIKIFADTGLCMTIFSLGLFMASQPRIIAGGYKLAAFTAAIRFIAAPATAAAAGVVVGLRGTLLQIIIMQGALPQAIVSFVFAQEYNIYPGVMSTAVSLGMLISLPTTLVYYIILGFCIK